MTTREREIEAENWIIKNRLHIHAALDEGDLKKVLIDAYLAGQYSITRANLHEYTDEEIDVAVKAQMQLDKVVSYKDL